MKGHGFSRAANAEQVGALKGAASAAIIQPVLKGHGFSRAAKQPEFSWALAPEGWFGCIQYVPQRLKPPKLAPSSAPFGKLRAGFEAAPFQNIEIFPQPLKSVPFIHHAKNPNAIALRI
ncbi:MAG: hypothetical protein ABSG62_05670 [Terracidiphilus sp.]